jgi:response regulator RpfG family c-di-GMP phosphodiesterase
MFDQDAKTIRKMAPMLKRVLIVDPLPAGATVITELLREVAVVDAYTAVSNDKALKLANKVVPEIIFCELSSEKVDGVAFTRKLRRSELACRKAPVILVTGVATAATILAARDAGVHEFLRKPFTMKDMLRRLEAVTLRQRGWIEAVDYVGPDRRRFNSGDYSGPLKRQTDTDDTPDTARIAQALKIVRSAIGAVETDPTQAMRALFAQAADLDRAATALGDEKLALVTSDFHRFLFEAKSAERVLSRIEVERRATPLLAYMPIAYDERRVVLV